MSCRLDKMHSVRNVHSRVYGRSNLSALNLAYRNEDDQPLSACSMKRALRTQMSPRESLGMSHKCGVGDGLYSTPPRIPVTAQHGRGQLCSK